MLRSAVPQEFPGEWEERKPFIFRVKVKDKDTTREEQAYISADCFFSFSDFLLGSLFYPDDGSNKSHCNVGKPPEHTASHLTR
jgi:hypothetical protein